MTIVVIVLPEQMVWFPFVADTEGVGLTRIALVGALTQPVLVWVNLKVAVPFITPVTTPASVTVAMASELLAQVPPVVGVKLVVEPMQITFVPVIFTLGLAFTVTLAVALALHVLVLVAVTVKLNPPAMLLLNVAGLLLLLKVPPLAAQL